MRVEGAQLCTVDLLEQSTDPTHFDDLLVARTLVDTTRENIPLRVLNLSHQQRTIRKGTQLAACNTVNYIVGAPSPVAKQISGQVQRTTTVEELPPHLKDLLARSVTGLTETESVDVCQLLAQFSDVFSAGPHDLGCTNLIKHHIDTGCLGWERRKQPDWFPENIITLSEAISKCNRLFSKWLSTQHHRDRQRYVAQSTVVKQAKNKWFQQKANQIELAMLRGLSGREVWQGLREIQPGRAGLQPVRPCKNNQEGGWVSYAWA